MGQKTMLKQRDWLASAFGDVARLMPLKTEVTLSDVRGLVPICSLGVRFCQQLSVESPFKIAF